jgi:regulatory protein
VSDAIIDALLSENQGSELERAREVWKKKFGTPPVNTEEKAKHIRFMQSRGFGLEVIRYSISGENDWDENPR